MIEQQHQNESRIKPQAPTHWVLWSVVTVFIILAIGGMWALDFYYSPEMISPNTVPEAVGK